MTIGIVALAEEGAILLVAERWRMQSMTGRKGFSPPQHHHHWR
jgi:hypothetical protein